MSSKLKKFFIAALSLIVIVAAVLAFMMYVEVEFLDGDSVTIKKAFIGTELDFPMENCPDGYTFLGWEDSEGNIHSSTNIFVNGRESYSAAYKLKLSREKHDAFILPEDDSFYHLDKPITRAQVIDIIYGFMSKNLPHTENFSDVTEGDYYFEAAAVFNSLDLIEGDRLSPQEIMTGEELAAILSHFDTAADYSASEVPTGQLSRIQAIEQLLRAVGCTAASTVPEDLRGAVPDISPDDAIYAVILEAAIDHEHIADSGNYCVWREYDSVSVFEPGFFFIDNRLHYAHEDGSLARSEKIGGLDFDSNAVFTTGVAELDEIVFSILDEIVTEDMTGIDKLKAAYYYVLDNSKYLKGNLYDRGQTGWAEEEALSMLSTGYGNCYGYAAAFCELAKALGYDAIVYSGNMGVDHDPHGWVEISIDGENYYFDPQLEMSCRKRNEYEILFMLPESHAKKWSYVH